MLKTFDHSEWSGAFSESEKAQALKALEQGQVVFFPHLNFSFLPEESDFFTTRFSTAKSKNISYNAKTKELRGTDCDDFHKRQFERMMQRYVDATSRLMRSLFPLYTTHLQTGRTSFRPVEIKGRQPKSIRKDDTKLHVDAFPTTPTQGRRIIRVFCNVDPNNSPRVWRVGEPFEEVAKRFLPKVRRQWPLRSFLLQHLRLTRGKPTEYDYTMLQLHHLMKMDPDYQQTVSQQELQFQSGCTWMVFTDQVSHAALSGQYILEQTFYLPVYAQAYPQLSPLKTLERLTGRVLV